jgi:hypothetical protein
MTELADGAQSGAERTGRQVLIAEAWHDITCAQRAKCQDRGAHASQEPVDMVVTLEAFLDRFVELEPGDSG